MELFYRIVSLLGGLAMFLYGMRIMGDGLKSSSGGAMKAALAKITNKPFMGFLLGMLVTCMIQSSTATIVLSVGLVGAGFITFRQSIGIVLGANVGTAITAQIIRLMDVQADAGSLLYFFKSDNLAPMALIIGIILIMFVKGHGSDAVGTVCMGFGILFVGLMNMSTAVSQFGDSLSHLLVSFEGNYALGFLSGVVVTGVIQSSSAVVGILQSVASSVGVTFCAVFSVIIGVNIGDCITTYLVCRIGAKPEQIRTCLVHIIYNVIAAVLIFLVIGITRATGILNDDIWYLTMNSGGVANVHGLFRLVPALLLLPFAGVFAKIAEKIVPDKREDDEDAALKESLSKLDERLVTNPALALNETSIVIGNMCEVAHHNYTAAIQQLFDYDLKREERIRSREELLDTMADACNQYIVAISPHIILDAHKRESSFHLQALVVFERIGDLAVNIIDYIGVMHDADEHFSETGQQELAIAMDAVNEILQLTADAYSTGDVALAKKVEPLEEVIDELIEELQDRHVQRMIEGRCAVFNGIQFQNMLLNLERVSDQCSDLAVHLLGANDPAILGKEHQYIHELHHSDDPEYHRQFDNYHMKYIERLPL